MELGVLFWVVYVIGVLVTGWLYRAGTGPVVYPWGPPLVGAALLFLLGWRVFGFVVK